MLGKSRFFLLLGCMQDAGDAKSPNYLMVVLADDARKTSFLVRVCFAFFAFALPYLAYLLYSSLMVYRACINYTCCLSPFEITTSSLMLSSLSELRHYY